MDLMNQLARFQECVRRRGRPNRQQYQRHYGFALGSPLLNMMDISDENKAQRHCHPDAREKNAITND